ncbi:fumarylacetoacetate hydrolase family protein [Leifsonia shinshuensis]|uniref:Fumarylacetoacetate hydrolase family protein n=1 Tax=Leifsonia shinshuensis TaxID=150026 RepID=A0A7G6YA76_9MICO|nr:fumarylacetoacetate hydrolase family protein [Leifsonia shinshuensis]QNE35391.1 fumarylacetoacetate hydrolase family protein [Leifsonia shinshuensis]
MSAISLPGKIIAVHLNYRSRAAQRGRTPAQPSYFFKPASSISGTGAELERPAGTELLAFEGEVALIIGRPTRRVTPEQGWAAVSGVTAANDFGLYDLRAADRGSNVRSKGGDGFTPLGPAIIPAASVQPDALRVRTWLNGELVQDDTTDGLLFPFGQLVADLSQLMTLEPGDVILTGTPAGSSVTVPGDVVEVEVDAPTVAGAPSSGRLVTRITEGTAPFGDFGSKPSVDDLQRSEAWGRRSSGAAFELTAELRAKLASVATATLSSQLRKRGLDNVSIDGLTSTRPEARIVGTAKTLRYLPNREDLFAWRGGGYNIQKRSFDAVGAGEVLVIEARGERGSGTVGDVLALRAQVNGAAGIVTDGGVRDLAVVAALDIPTYHSGPHPAVLGRKHVPWDADVAIACGGATVLPGDVIVGDADGLLVIPPALVEEVVADAIEQEREEEFIAEMVAAGERIEGLFPMNAAWKERYAAWLTQR